MKQVSRDGTSSHHLYCTNAQVGFYEQVWTARKCIALNIDFVSAHSHTLENRSSPAPNPVAGFAGVIPVPGVTGAALLHPPKSSSAVTFGVAPTVLNPPPPPGTILVFANDPPEPHPPKLPELVCVGATLDGLVGFAEPQASFDPQASLFAHPLICAGGDCGLGGGAGDERLKTEVDWGGGDAIVCFGWAGGCGDGAEKSKRSPSAELAFVLETGVGIPGAESKAPNPLDELNPLDGCGGCGAGFEAGFISKKLPPLRGGGEF